MRPCYSMDGTHQPVAAFAYAARLERVTVLFRRRAAPGPAKPALSDQSVRLEFGIWASPHHFCCQPQDDDTWHDPFGSPSHTPPGCGARVNRTVAHSRARKRAPAVHFQLHFEIMSASIRQCRLLQLRNHHLVQVHDLNPIRRCPRPCISPLGRCPQRPSPCDRRIARRGGPRRPATCYTRGALTEWFGSGTSIRAPQAGPSVAVWWKKRRVACNSAARPGLVPRELAARLNTDSMSASGARLSRAAARKQENVVQK